MLLVGALAAPAAASKPSDSPDLEGGHRVTICHATSSSNPANFWHVITVDIASSGGRDKLMGHLEHAREPNKKDERGDAIPQFSYPGFPPFEGEGLGQPGLPQACGGGPSATLVVIKEVINDSGGGSSSAADFTIDVTGTNASPASFAGSGAPGTVVTLAPGAYSVAERDHDLPYDVTYSAECDGTIGADETRTCVITNDDRGGG
jgi:hypothetical protein